MTGEADARNGMRLRCAVVSSISAGVVVLYALRGGTYDIVARQEAGLAIWFVLALGFALGLLPVARPARLAAAVPVALLAFTTWTAISLSWSDSAERTLIEIARDLHYAGLVLLVLLVLDRTTWRAAAGGLLAGALAVCALSVASRLAPAHFPANRLRGSFPADSQRLSYPFGYWNAVGTWGAMAIAMGLAWSAHARSTAVRALCLAGLPVAGLAVYLAYSRGGAAATVAGAIVVLALARHRWTAFAHLLVAGAACVAVALVARSQPAIAHATGSAGAGSVAAVLAVACAVCAATAIATGRAGADVRWRLAPPRARAGLAALGIAVVVAGAVAGPGLASRAWDDFRNTPNAPVGAARLTTLGGNRYAIWSADLKAFDAHPARGIGAGNFEFWWNRHGSIPQFLRDGHSIFLEPMAELGWPGLALVLVVLAVAFGAALSARRALAEPADVGATAGLIAAGAAFFVVAGVDWMWEMAAVGTLGVGALAVAAAARGEPGARLRIAPRAALALAALAATAVQVPGLVSTSLVRESQSSARAGDIAGARAHAAAAVESQPWAATPYVQRALVAEQAGDLRAARDDFARAVAHEPTNWRHRLLLARVEAQLGHPQAALRALRSARALRARQPLDQP